MTMELCDRPATELRQEIQDGHLGARELLAAHIERIARCNPDVNALVTLDLDAAMAEAARADERQARGEPLGLLHGLPMVHKDCFATQGMRTTQGSPLYRDFVPTVSSLLVQREQAAGAITLGKSNIPEFCAGSHTVNTLFGATRNPYDLRRSAGGSSGGAAAALACGMAALADGSDMGGSLRNPASFCNVVGLRPSPGRVPQWPTLNPYNLLTVVGPMGRTVGDVALLLAAMAGPDARDPMSIEQDPALFLGSLEGGVAGSRVAFAPTWGGLPTDPAVTQVIEAQASVLEAMGAQVSRACPDFSDADHAFQTLRGVAFDLAYGELADRHPDAFKPAIHWNIGVGREAGGSDIARAEKARAALFQQMHGFMQSHDFLVGAVSQVPPFPVEWEHVQEIAGTPMGNYIDWMRSGYYLSLTGLPAISVPCGFTADGLPVGLQIVGRYRQERALLAFAHAFEQAVPCRHRLPPLLAGL
ncbi:amidase [Xylophilus rhododendri]|uniref:Amidase n=1 Tax=Xylophilus rhododendri TaxID=2697032 RepID=A0A857J2U6_9BURK|nr:amidase [Xylophilus rhododendri]QHI97218.1 amidase [Xylophilus rhododendri]